MEEDILRRWRNIGTSPVWRNSESAMGDSVERWARVKPLAIEVSGSHIATSLIPVIAVRPSLIATIPSRWLTHAARFILVRSQEPVAVRLLYEGVSSLLFYQLRCQSIAPEQCNAMTRAVFESQLRSRVSDTGRYLDGWCFRSPRLWCKLQYLQITQKGVVITVDSNTFRITVISSRWYHKVSQSELLFLLEMKAWGPTPPTYRDLKIYWTRQYSFGNMSV